MRRLAFGWWCSNDFMMAKPKGKSAHTISSSELESAEEALSIMKAWRWVRYDPDGVASATSMGLATAVSKLAYFGHDDPKTALLALFSSGQIEGKADFQWAKYASGETYRLHGKLSRIEPVRWQSLRRGLALHENYVEDGVYDPAIVSLPALQREDVSIADWEPRQNRCSYALRPTDSPPGSAKYWEEAFLAENIVIFPLAIPGPDGEIFGIADEATEAEVTNDNNDTKRGRKPKYDWPAATLAVFGLIYRGDLKPENQADIERALIDHLASGDNTPSESTVRPHARQIWVEYSKA